jgi:hypothetical protein
MAPAAHGTPTAKALANANSTEMSAQTVTRWPRPLAMPYVASAAAARSARHAFRLAAAPRINTSQIETTVVIFGDCLRP